MYFSKRVTLLCIIFATINAFCSHFTSTYYKYFYHFFCIKCVYYTEFQLDLQQRNSKPANIFPTQLENPIFDKPLLVIQEDQFQEDAINDTFHSTTIPFL